MLRGRKIYVVGTKSGIWMVDGVGGMWMIIFWGVIIGLVVWGVRALTNQKGQSIESASPLEIAQRRYDREEISKEEFNDIKATLGR